MLTLVLVPTSACRRPRSREMLTAPIGSFVARHEPHNFFKVLAGKRRARIEPCVFDVPMVPIFRTCGHKEETNDSG